MKKTAVVAIGGNSLIKDGNHQSFSDQLKTIRQTCVHIASMIETGWRVVITHGNGPQVGFILLRSDMARRMLDEVPLDACGADTQGEIGYMIQQALHDEFAKRKIRKEVVTVVTQTLVNKNDPAFKHPSKPIGPFYSKTRAFEHKKKEGWNIVEDAGRGWRRVVPSPRPLKIIEQNAIKALIDQGIVVTAVGGGGIPVIQEDGELKGVEAVIDKDYASALLATGLRAELFLICTAVEQICLDFGKPSQRPLTRMSLSEAKKYLKQGQFPAGSMGPKIQAIINFLEKGGKGAVVTSPESIEKALQRKTGTYVTRAG